MTVDVIGSAPRPIADAARRAGAEASHSDGVRAMFDRIAPRYDRLNRVLSMGIDQAWRRAAADALEPLPEGSLLDLCAGTLDFAALLEGRFADRRVVAVDLSESMLARGRARGVAPRTETVIGDATRLPFADGSFAAVISGFGLRNVADLPAALAEARRVLVQRGKLVILDFFRPETLAVRALHALYCERVIPTVGRVLGGDRAAYQYLVDSMRGFITRERMHELLETAGFVGIAGREHTFGIACSFRAEVPA